MNFFKGKKFLTIVMVAVLLAAGFINHNYNNGGSEQTAKILGEASYVNNNIYVEDSDKTVLARNSREKARDEAKEMLEDIVNNPNSTEEGRKKAEQEIIEMATVIKNESDCEMLLKQKGFEDAVVTITSSGAQITVSTKDLMHTEIAQITETVSSVTGFNTDRIKILSDD